MAATKKRKAIVCRCRRWLFLVAPNGRPTRTAVRAGRPRGERSVFRDVLKEPHEYRRRLRAGRAAGGRERPPAGAGDQALFARPRHRLARVVADLRSVRVAEKVLRSADAHVVALHLGVAVQNQDKLLARNIVRGSERAVAVAADNRIRRRPANRVREPFAARHIGERVAAGRPSWL